MMPPLDLGPFVIIICRGKSYEIPVKVSPEDAEYARARGNWFMQKAAQMNATPHPKGKRYNQWYSPATRNLRAKRAYQMHEAEK